MTTTIDVIPCRRCTECEGEAHHFMGPEPIPGEDGDDAGFTCKHCPYTTPAVECAECEDLFPVDILRRPHANGDQLCPDCFSKEMARHDDDE